MSNNSITKTTPATDKNTLNGQLIAHPFQYQYSDLLHQRQHPTSIRKTPPFINVYNLANRGNKNLINFFGDKKPPTNTHKQQTTWTPINQPNNHHTAAFFHNTQHTQFSNPVSYQPGLTQQHCPAPPAIEARWRAGVWTDALNRWWILLDNPPNYMIK